MVVCLSSGPSLPVPILRSPGSTFEPPLGVPGRVWGPMWAQTWGRFGDDKIAKKNQKIKIFEFFIFSRLCSEMFLKGLCALVGMFLSSGSSSTSQDQHPNRPRSPRIWGPMGTHIWGSFWRWKKSRKIKIFDFPDFSRLCSESFLEGLCAMMGMFFISMHPTRPFTFKRWKAGSDSEISMEWHWLCIHFRNQRKLRKFKNVGMHADLHGTRSCPGRSRRTGWGGNVSWPVIHFRHDKYCRCSDSF